MKMTKENYKKVLEVYKENKELISIHKEHLKANATYQDLNTRLVFDIWYSQLFPLEQRRIIAVDEEGEHLNDNHLKTGFVKALKEIGLKE
nr:MAG TPA: hypothetical protein [Herelleviridae sp.]